MASEKMGGTVFRMRPRSTTRSELMAELALSDYMLMSGEAEETVFMCLGHRPRNEVADAAYLMLCGHLGMERVDSVLDTMAAKVELPEIPLIGLLVGVKYVKAVFSENSMHVTPEGDVDVSVLSLAPFVVNQP